MGMERNAGLPGTFVMVRRIVYSWMIIFDILPIAWAEKKGFYTSKAARPDTYRAGERVCGCVCRYCVTCSL